MQMAGNKQVNVGQLERAVSVALGGLFVLRGLRQGKLLGPLMTAAGGTLLYRGMTGHCPAYAAIGAGSEDARFASGPLDRSIEIHRSITINRSPQEIFDFISDAGNLLPLSPQVQSVELFGDHESHWVARTRNGRAIRWDMRITQRQPNELIEWQSPDHSEIDHHGRLTLTPAPAGRGTQLHLTVTVHPPYGLISIAIARVTAQSPEGEIHEAMRRLKQVLESGEFATGEGPSGREAREPQPHTTERLREGRGSRTGASREAPSIVDEASEESFPASDAPGWRR